MSDDLSASKTALENPPSGDTAVMRELTATTAGGACISATLVNKQGLVISQKGESANRLDTARLTEMFALAGALETNEKPESIVIESKSKTRTMVQPMSTGDSLDGRLITVHPVKR